MEISFKNLAAIPDSEEKKLTIDFPFSLLPIFYYKGVNTFIKFLSIVIKINNFENIVFCKEKIFEALDIIKDYNYTKEEKNKPEEMVNSQITIKNIIDLKPNAFNRNNSYLKNNNFIFFWTTNIYSTRNQKMELIYVIKSLELPLHVGKPDISLQAGQLLNIIKNKVGMNMHWVLKEGNNSFIFILTKQDKSKLELLKIFLMKSKKFMKKTKEKFLIFCQILYL